MDSNDAAAATLPATIETTTGAAVGAPAGRGLFLCLAQIVTGGNRSGVLLVSHAGLRRLGGDTGRAYQQLNGLLVLVGAAGVPAAA